MKRKALEKIIKEVLKEHLWISGKEEIDSETLKDEYELDDETIIFLDLMKEKKRALTQPLLQLLMKKYFPKGTSQYDVIEAVKLYGIKIPGTLEPQIGTTKI